VRTPATERGFTLLEVMIALAILGLCVTTLTRSQLASVRAARRAKMMTVATMLARYKMIEVEDKLFDEGFSDFKQEEKKTFKDEGFDRLGVDRTTFEQFSYDLVVDKVELPASMNAEGLQEAVRSMTGTDQGSGSGSSKSSSGSSPTGMASGLASAATGMIGKQMEMVRNLLEQSIRRVEVKVEWKEGKTAHNVTVSGYFTDPRKIDAALGGGLPAGVQDLLKGQTGTGTNPLTGTRTTTGTGSGTGTGTTRGETR
jgi:general secretion pathway protein I